MDRQTEDSAPWTAATHDLDFAVREYLLLHDQHQELCQRLHDLCPSLSTPTSIPTSTSMSLSLSLPTPSLSSSLSSSTSTTFSLASTSTASSSVSPTRSPWDGDAASSAHIHGNHHNPINNESLIGEVAAGEKKLFDVNEGLKRALTELLNCDAVRQDKAMRTWVQTRLLETEKELRRGRRRRSSAATD